MVMRIGGKGIGLIIVFAKMHRDKMIHLDGVDKLLCAAHIILTQAGIDGEHSGIKMWISSGKQGKLLQKGLFVPNGLFAGHLFVPMPIVEIAGMKQLLFLYAHGKGNAYIRRSECGGMQAFVAVGVPGL